jgi:hypothetical protein
MSVVDDSEGIRLVLEGGLGAEALGHLVEADLEGRPEHVDDVVSSRLPELGELGRLHPVVDGLLGDPGDLFGYRLSSRNGDTDGFGLLLSGVASRHGYTLCGMRMTCGPNVPMWMNGRAS